MAANTRLYTLANHCRSLVEAFRSVARVGSATFRMVRSRLMTRALTASAARAHHRRPLTAVTSATAISVVAMRATLFQWRQLYESSSHIFYRQPGPHKGWITPIGPSR